MSLTSLHDCVSVPSLTLNVFSVFLKYYKIKAFKAIPEKHLTYVLYYTEKSEHYILQTYNRFRKSDFTHNYTN